ncbi:WhiB family transcriptional regulator [Mycobacterium sp. WMMD1722]|uniref:WhiB family transcriptional regulator n=1 Tax=Mycobacterium sp. WMMD1722 TaxID=3404117 RepID=UPI003BF4CF2B
MRSAPASATALPEVTKSSRARPGTNWRANPSQGPRWEANARCLGLPTEIFFIADTTKGSRRIAHEKRAKRICEQCPVRQNCLSFAVTSGQQHGIWGALTPRERRQLPASEVEN